MNAIRDLLLVALGGGIGAVTRYGIGLAMAHLLGKTFPWGTLVANVVGCLLAGIIGQRVAMLETMQANPAAAHFLRVALMIGFLGGLTTFSAFGWETVRDLTSAAHGAQSIAFLNIAANLLLGLAAVWLGMQVARWWS